jgi:hypothetical protein
LLSAVYVQEDLSGVQRVRDPIEIRPKHLFAIREACVRLM